MRATTRRRHGARRPPRRGCRAAPPRRRRRPPRPRCSRPAASWRARAPAPWPPPTRPPLSRDRPPKVQGRNDTAPDRSTDLRLAAGPRAVGHVVLDHLPVRGGRPDQQFQRIPGAAVGHTERQHVASRRATRIGAMSCTGSPCAAAQPPAHRRVAQARMPRPRQPGHRPALRRRPCRRRDRVPSTSRGRSRGSMRAVTVEHRHDRCLARPRCPRARPRRIPARVSRTTWAPHRRRHVGGAVGAVVVDHQGQVAGRQLGQHRGQRFRLVQARQHHRDPTSAHGCETSQIRAGQYRRKPDESVTSRR